MIDLFWKTSSKRTVNYKLPDHFIITKLNIVMLEQNIVTQASYRQGQEIFKNFSRIKLVFKDFYKNYTYTIKKSGDYAILEGRQL